MTHMLGTFNQLQQSRFEAFRRATFQRDAISNYVAYCLASCHEQAYGKSERVRQMLDKSGLGMGDPRAETAMKQSGERLVGGIRLEVDRPKRMLKIAEYPRLQDMVAPSQSENIVLVVSTLAKAYAQRLIGAARKVAMMEQRHGVGEALLPTDVLRAQSCLQHAGLDPGFLMMPQQESSRAVVGESDAVRAAVFGIENEYETMRNAAFAAQEEYDRLMVSQTDSDSMEVDNVEQTEETTATLATAELGGETKDGLEKKVDNEGNGGRKDTDDVDDESDDSGDDFEVLEEQVLGGIEVPDDTIKAAPTAAPKDDTALSTVEEPVIDKDVATMKEGKTETSRKDEEQPIQPLEQQQQQEQPTVQQQQQPTVQKQQQPTVQPQQQQPTVQQQQPAVQQQPKPKPKKVKPPQPITQSMEDALLGDLDDDSDTDSSDDDDAGD